MISAEVEKSLDELHTRFLSQNPYDEGDLLYCRINYRLADKMQRSLAEAEAAHSEYHAIHPRHVSEGMCDVCNRLVRIVPIIYGYDRREIQSLKASEAAGRLIIGETVDFKEGSKIALFGCSVCKTPLASYGTA